MLAMSTEITTYGFELLAVAWQIVTLCAGSGLVVEATDATAAIALIETNAVTVVRVLARRMPSPSSCASEPPRSRGSKALTLPATEVGHYCVTCTQSTSTVEGAATAPPSPPTPRLRIRYIGALVMPDVIVPTGRRRRRYVTVPGDHGAERVPAGGR